MKDEHWAICGEVAKLESEIEILKMKQEFDMIKIDDEEEMKGSKPSQFKNKDSSTKQSRKKNMPKNQA